MPGFLLSRRWLAFALFVVVLAGVSIRLGFWQMDKLEQRVERNALVTEHFAAEPVPLDAAVPRGEDLDAQDEWRRVMVTGVYDADHQVTVKFSTRDGAPGVDVVTPLVLDDGTAVLVNRGWMPTENTAAAPTDVPAPPAGVVQATGWLREDNGAGPQAVEPVDGQVRAVSSLGMAEAVPHELRRGFLNLREQSPRAAEGLAAEPEPDLGQGPHFFYALQWWFFALLAIVGYGWFARAEVVARRNPNRIDHFAPTPVRPG